MAVLNVCRGYNTGSISHTTHDGRKSRNERVVILTIVIGGGIDSGWGCGGGGGGCLDDLYLDVCVEGLKKYPIQRTLLVSKHTHTEAIFFIVHTHNYDNYLDLSIT